MSTNRIRKITTLLGLTRTPYQRARDVDATELYALTSPTESRGDSIDRSIHAPAVSLRKDNPGNSGKWTWIYRYKDRLSGWRFGVLSFAISALVVGSVNLAITIWGSVAWKVNQGLLYAGDCEQIRKLNIGIHLLINVFSTILLSGSNYCMQCLSAPTRKEIDQAHVAGTWLDIGIPSFRNLKNIERRRVVLWFFLGLSSLPLHLLYNSAVYPSLVTNHYDVVLVSRAFLKGGEDRDCIGPTYETDSYLPSDSNASLEHLSSMLHNNSLERLERKQCITEYAKAVSPTRRNLLLVAADEEAKPERAAAYKLSNGRPCVYGVKNNTAVYWMNRFDAEYGLKQFGAPRSYDWICSNPDYLPRDCSQWMEEIKKAPQWKLSHRYHYRNQQGSLGYELWAWSVDYCLSERVTARCELHFSTAIAVIVTILNFFKAALMFYTYFSTKEEPLMTIGDALASFLDKRDAATKELGLFTVYNRSKRYRPGANSWRDPHWRWKNATSQTRHAVVLVLLVSKLSTILGLLIWGVKAIGNIPTAFSLGFGAVDPRALIHKESKNDGWPTNIIGLTLIANLPQVLLSFVYFMYNGVFTAMLTGHEWMSYATKRKGLRMSCKPLGSQRSTYFLQLPYRFSLPLAVTSVLLHWLVSQSIFVVAFNIYDQMGHRNWNGHEEGDIEDGYTTCGYSPIAMLTVLIVGLFMLVAVVGFGYIHYKTRMPLAGSSSLAISAACHPEEDSGKGEHALSRQKLQWGVVSIGLDGVGHCAFSSTEVGPLLDGQVYT